MAYQVRDINDYFNGPDEDEVREFYMCGCTHLGHTLLIEFFKDDPECGFYLSMSLYQHNGFFKRVWQAIKYVFGCRRGTSDYDHIMLIPDDARALRARLDEYLQCLEEKKEKA